MLKFSRLFKELQEDTASKSNKSKIIVAENSGHCINFDEPELIVNAIYELVEMYKKNRDK